MRRDAPAGVDQVTADEYDRDLEGNLAAYRCLKDGTYRAPPVRRVRIPKAGGKFRPIGVPTFEDKIVQRAVVMLLEPIYEQDFLDCSWGFRPGRGVHGALARLWKCTMRMRGGWILDVDVEDFFGSLDHKTLLDLLAERIGDRRILRLIGKWIKAGVMEEGVLERGQRGTPQGGGLALIGMLLLGGTRLRHLQNLAGRQQRGFQWSALAGPIGDLPPGRDEVSCGGCREPPIRPRPFPNPPSILVAVVFRQNGSGTVNSRGSISGLHPPRSRLAFGMKTARSRRAFRGHKGRSGERPTGPSHIRRKRTCREMIALTNTQQQKTTAGTVSIFALLGMVALLAVGSLAIDAGYVYVARTDLQNAADAAALSGAAELGDIYMDLDESSHASYVMSSLDRSRVVTAIGAIAGHNRAVGQVVNISDPAVSVGTWDFPTRSLTTTNLQPRAISALAQRTDAVNGPVGSFFARVIGRDSFNVAARSTAALTPLGGVPEGAVTLPVGISTAWFTNNSCDQPIKFHPTGTLEGCAGWHTYDQTPANASTLRNTLQGIESGAYQAPSMAAGDVANFTGGTVASSFPEMQQLYDTRRFEESPSDEFDALVVVYDSPGCSNPSGAVKVVGFASVTVTGVETSPENTIDAVVRCDRVHEGTGGGGDFGTLSSIPVLVQ